MSAFEDYPSVPAEFTGVVRLFPVPNLVMFPHVTQPLHVFERRYCDLLEDAMQDDQLMAMAVLSPGWEADYDGRPRLGPFACLGRVAASEPLEDGSRNLLLAGLRRVRLFHELSPRKSYREATAAVCEDCYPPNEVDRTETLRQTLCRQLAQLLPASPPAREQTDRLLRRGLSLGILTDVLGYGLELDLSAKEALLCEVDVHRRAEVLLGHLSAAAGNPRSWTPHLACFPPSFSAN